MIFAEPQNRVAHSTHFVEWTTGEASNQASRTPNRTVNGEL